MWTWLRSFLTRSKYSVYDLINEDVVEIQKVHRGRSLIVNEHDDWKVMLEPRTWRIQVCWKIGLLEGP